MLRSQLSRYRTALATVAGGKAHTATTAEPMPGVEAASALDKIRLESQLREALERNELEVRLQPIMDIPTHRIAGNDARTHWTHPNRGALSTAELNALAEETALTQPMRASD